MLFVAATPTRMDGFYGQLNAMNQIDFIANNTTIMQLKKSLSSFFFVFSLVSAQNMAPFVPSIALKQMHLVYGKEFNLSSDFCY